MGVFFILFSSSLTRKPTLEQHGNAPHCTLTLYTALFSNRKTLTRAELLQQALPGLVNRKESSKMMEGEDDTGSNSFDQQQAQCKK